MAPRILRRVVERMLSWYDPKVEASRDERTEAIRQRSIRARVRAEEVRAAYAAAARELHR